ncbi:MAG: glycosyltransferase [Betaproteobacteria bacterium]|nr:glycosyltransferase [Betaproteobacteria bacterium]
MSPPSVPNVLNVLMVSDVYFPRVNGVSTSIETFRQTLAQEGVNIRLVAPRYNGEPPDELGIVRIPGKPAPGSPEDRLPRWRLLAQAVRREAARADVIHIQTPFAAHYAGLQAARALKRPVLATYHTLFEEYFQHYARVAPASFLRGIARSVSKSQCNALDAVVVPSSAMRERLRDYGVTTDLHVVPTGIPLARFSSGDRARFRAQHGIAEDRPVALYVGRVAHEKNLNFLIDAFARAVAKRSNLLLLVTGEGPALEDLRARVAALGLNENVRFLGYLDRRTELPDCYAAADAFVFASLTETQGLVLLEAMAQGLPVIGLAAMGTKDILAPNLGCMTPLAELDSFAEAIVRLMKEPDLRTRLSAEAREYATRWSDRALAARLAGLYRTMHDGP